MDLMPPSGLNDDAEQALDGPSWFADALANGILGLMWDGACRVFGSLFGSILDD